MGPARQPAPPGAGDVAPGAPARQSPASESFVSPEACAPSAATAARRSTKRELDAGEPDARPMPCQNGSLAEGSWAAACAGSAPPVARMGAVAVSTQRATWSPTVHIGEESSCKACWSRCPSASRLESRLSARRLVPAAEVRRPCSSWSTPRLPRLDCFRMSPAGSQPLDDCQTARGADCKSVSREEEEAEALRSTPKHSEALRSRSVGRRRGHGDAAGSQAASGLKGRRSKGAEVSILRWPLAWGRAEEWSRLERVRR